MTDPQRLAQAALTLLPWLKKFPEESKGKQVEAYVEVDGVRCKLTLTPMTFVSDKRKERARKYRERSL